MKRMSKRAWVLVGIVAVAARHSRRRVRVLDNRRNGHGLG